MCKSLLKATCVLLATVGTIMFVSPSTANADIVFSEGFESPALPTPSSVGYTLGQGTASGTFPTQCNFFVLGSDNYGAPYGTGAGSQYLVCNPWEQPAAGSVYWDFAVDAGQHTLTFDHKVYGYHSPESQMLGVSVMAGSTTLLADTMSDSGGGLPSALATYSKTFTATSAGTVRLRLTDVTTSANGWDLLVDNIQVNSVPSPEPGAIVLLTTGLIGLLCYAWRKRKQADL